MVGDASSTRARRDANARALPLGASALAQCFTYATYARAIDLLNTTYTVLTSAGKDATRSMSRIRVRRDDCATGGGIPHEPPRRRDCCAPTQRTPREHSMAPRNSIPALKSALADLAATGDRRADHLKRRVFNVVDELKSSGLPPEGIVITVKSLLAETPALESPAQLEQILVDWCFERYYAGARGS